MHAMTGILMFALIGFIWVANLYGLPVTQDLPLMPENPELIAGQFEGDMILPPPTARGLVSNADNVRWPNGTVPYIISTDYNATDRATIVNAMRTLENLTAIGNQPCVQFRDKTDSDGEYYIMIINGTGCSAYVGRSTGITVNRTVILQTPICILTGHIIHELMHSLGFYHEQSRPDRDSYVTVITDNIIPAALVNFDKYNTSQANTLNTSYDLGSIMHYARDAFSINGSDTLVPFNSSAIIGQRITMSPTDIETVRLFYGCTGPTTTPIPIPITSTSTTSTSTPTTSTSTPTTSTSTPTASTSTTSTSTSTASTSTPTTSTSTSTHTASTSTTSTSTSTASTSTSTASTSTPTTSTSTSTPTASTSTTSTSTPKTSTSTSTASTFTATTSASVTSTSTSTTSTSITSSSTTSTSTSITPTSTTSVSTTTTPITTTLSTYQMTLSYLLTISSSQYRRIGGQSSNYYYVAQQLTVSTSGNYTFTSSSNFVSYGYIYSNSFDPSNPLTNLIAQDQSGDDGKFQLTVFLQVAGGSIKKRATNTYTMVLTSRDAGETGSISINIDGPATITITNPGNATITITNNVGGGSDSGNNAGIIAGSVVGGVIFLISICGLCLLAVCVSFYFLEGTPIRSNKAYVRDGFRMQRDIGNTIFQSGSFAGFYFKNGTWHGTHDYTLAFYPQADHTVYGKGTDHTGSFVVTGSYSPRALRMGFEKRYQTGLGDAIQTPGPKTTIQVEWNPATLNFEGKYYSKAGRRREEQKYMMQIKDAKYRR